MKSKLLIFFTVLGAFVIITKLATVEGRGGGGRGGGGRGGGGRGGGSFGGFFRRRNNNDKKSSSSSGSSTPILSSSSSSSSSWSPGPPPAMYSNSYRSYRPNYQNSDDSLGSVVADIWRQYKLRSLFESAHSDEVGPLEMNLESNYVNSASSNYHDDLFQFPFRTKNSTMDTIENIRRNTLKLPKPKVYEESIDEVPSSTVYPEEWNVESGDSGIAKSSVEQMVSTTPKKVKQHTELAEMFKKTQENLRKLDALNDEFRRDPTMDISEMFHILRGLTSFNMN